MARSRSKFTPAAASPSGISLGAVIAFLTLDLWVGRIESGHQEKSWLILGVVCIFGTVFAILNVILPALLIIAASVLIGTFMCCQV
eukprot:SAG31_NODE_11879_length_989_cov_1.044944_3_plen_85_part_01